MKLRVRCQVALGIVEEEVFQGFFGARVLLLLRLTQADAICGFFFLCGIVGFLLDLAVQAQGAVDVGVGEVGVGDSQAQIGAVGVVCLTIGAIGVQARLCAEGVGLYVGCFCVYDFERGVFCMVVVGEFLDEYFECCEALVLPFVWGFVFEGGSARLF